MNARCAQRQNPLIMYIDFLRKFHRGKCGHAYIFFVVDKFSKFVFLKEIKMATTAAVIKFLTK